MNNSYRGYSTRLTARSAIRYSKFFDILPISITPEQRKRFIEEYKRIARGRGRPRQQGVGEKN